MIKDIYHAIGVIAILFCFAFLSLPSSFAQTSTESTLDSLLEQSGEQLDIQIDSAEVTALKAITLADQLGLPLKKWRATERLSQVELRRSNYDECKAYLDKIFEYCETGTCDPDLLANIHNTRGAYYYRTSDLLAAGEDFLAAGAHYKESSTPERESSSKFNGAVVLMHTGGKERSFEILESLADDVSNEPVMRARAYVNMGLIRVSDLKPQEAIVLFQKGIQISVENDLNIDEGYLNLAILYEEEGKFSDALPLYSRLEKSFSDQGDTRLLFKVHMGLANTYAGLQNNRKALEYLGKAEVALDPVTQRGDYIDLLDVKHQLYANLGDLNSAYKYLKEYKEQFIAFEITKNKDKFMELQTQYETEQKELENQLLKSDKDLQQKVIYNQRTGLAAVMAILLLLAILAIYIYRQGKFKDKLNSDLHERNQKIELLHRELRHRVNNNLAFIASLMQIQSRRLKNPEAVEALFESESRVRAMSLLHRKLQLDAGDSAAISLKTYLEEVVYNLQQSYPFDRKAPEIQLSLEEVEIDAESAVRIGLIVNELVTNAYKHAFPEQDGGLIKITITSQDNNKFQLSYRDNGSGLPQDMELDKSNSMGIKLIHSLSKLLQAQPVFKSEDGTVFELEFTSAALA